jgi:hypothetical protein
MEEINKRLDKLDGKISRILELLEGDLKNNCEKMGEHIQFVEKVYDNIKHPLGYICNKVKSLSGKGNYSLEDKKN